MTEGLREVWERPGVQRARRVAYWAIMAVLVLLVVRRYLPDYSLPDLGPAPAIAYETLDGGTLESADLAGTVTVLNVWATWCPPCVVETPGFVDLQAEFEGDVRFVGISVDESAQPVHDFAARYGVTYPLLVGPNRAGPPVPAPVLPTTLVIDRQGRVRLRHEGLLLEPALRPVLDALVEEGG